MRSNKFIISTDRWTRLVRFSTTLVQDYSLAEDIVQDVQLKLLAHPELLKSVKNIEGFVYRMVKNRSLDVIRSNRYRSVELDASLNIHTEDLIRCLERNEMSEVAKLLIDKLPEKYRMVIYLKDVEQMSMEQVGVVLKMNTASVRVSLSRARKKIREQITNIYAYETK
ncbi:RNA polymerase sigma factor [Halosquirtibacter laminarini]|uniref:RNA polymerase sigma factor n=1 Tax=Halosquirtibacter laminarini TaxID=3374600 RepID=A0AC61NM51_9BACT|nr:RNA polymerase sigma factor [Prolixibacteraceae bacterium]